MGHVILAMGVVAVVGGEQRCVDAPGDLDQCWVGFVLGGETVVLQLHEEVAPAEDVLQSRSQGFGFDVIIGHEGLEDDAAEATSGGDEALGMAGKELPVDPRLVVVALEVGGRRELEEIAVALVALGQECQVVVELLAALDVAAGVVDPTAPHRALVTRLAGHVRLCADNGIDPGRTAGSVEVEDSVHVAVVGDPQRRLPVGHRRGHELLHPRRAVQHGELGMGVQVGERPCRQPAVLLRRSADVPARAGLQRCDSDPSATGARQLEVGAGPPDFAVGARGE